MNLQKRPKPSNRGWQDGEKKFVLAGTEGTETRAGRFFLAKLRRVFF